MKELLCQAFCDRVEFRKVPCGHAVTVPFTYDDGDPILFYVIPDKGDYFHLEDDGAQVPIIEASGVDISKGTRNEVFTSLLDDYGVFYNLDRRTLHTKPFVEDDLPKVALQFVAALLRLQDLAVLHPRTIKSTFREDAIAAIHNTFDPYADVIENAPVSPALHSYRSDVVISRPNKAPLVIYLGTSDEKGLQALVLKMETEQYQQIPCKVVLLVERAKENPLREPTYALAQARLDDVLAFRGVEGDAMERVRVLYEGSPSHIQ